MPQDPAAEYRARADLRRSDAERLNRADARFGIARLATFAAAVLVAVLWWRVALSAWWECVPLLLFIALVRRHDRVIRARDAAVGGVAFYERGLARMADRWTGTGEPGDRFCDDDHPYANDLDLFGRGSLFELLSTARTRGGEETLAAWLKSPADPDEIRARQEAIREIDPALDLREALSLAGSGVRASVDTEALTRWAEPPPLLPPRLEAAAIGLDAGALGAMVYWAVSSNVVALVAVVSLQSLLFLALRSRVERVTHAAGGPARDLEIVAGVLRHLETQRFSSERLSSLRSTLNRNSAPASRIVQLPRRFVDWHDWQHSLRPLPFLVLMIGDVGPGLILVSVMLASVHLAFAIERWRERHGARIRGWLEAVGQFEALSSLAGYRYEHPNDPFPEIITVPSGMVRSAATFDATSLGHPLLPSARMILNDLRLSGQTRMLVISGSNMSGKSTMLRTAGVNAVLAMAGAPVRAASLRLSPLSIGATLRIQDSLQEGRSRFYAEISRIRQLVDAAGGRRPLLFLLDELFHGTNSHDRLVGASGVLRSLLDLGAIGLITTHDLALTSVADQLTPRAANAHFEDWFDGHEIRFDYQMKPGPVTRSNALALMRAVGLDVSET